MRKILILMIFLMIAGTCSVYPQISVPGTPISADHYLPALNSMIVASERLSMKDIQEEDSLFPSPYRYGVILDAPADISHDGQWDHSPDGEVWRLLITAPGALAMAVYFDQFMIPAGGRFFLYDPSMTKTIGAFTSINNSPEGLFATELIPGDSVILEYDQPFGTSVPQIHISDVTYAYRGVSFVRRDFGSSGICEVNANCPEGWPWNQESKSVARIGVRKGKANYWCTGSLVNNVRRDHTPYFLTADHCGEGASADNLLQWLFYFHFEAPDCVDPLIAPIPRTMTGAVLMAKGGNSGQTGSDFFLIKFISSIPVPYDVYFNGWNRSVPSGTSGVTIHQPMGDIKKISTYTTGLHSAFYGSNPNQCFWKVRWAQTENGHGVTEGGSSGCPVFDASHYLVGTLTGGDSNCDSAHLNLYDYYGKFSYHWDSNGTDSTSRLMDWLDPDQTAATTLEGIPLAVEDHDLQQKITVYPNPTRDHTEIAISGSERKEMTATLYNSQGKIILTRNISFRNSNRSRIDFPQSSPGIYLLKITSGNDFFTTKLTIL